MNKPASIQLLSSYIEVEKFLDFLSTREIDWNSSFNYEPGRNEDFIKCQAYPIIQKFIFVDKDGYDELYPYLKDLIHVCYEKYGPGRIANLLFAKISNESRVRNHIDNGLDFLWSHRIHFPIQTHERCFFFVDDQPYHLKLGYLTEVNNLKIHRVENHSDNYHERIHMIFDYTPEEYYKYASKLTPTNEDEFQLRVNQLKMLSTLSNKKKNIFQRIWGK